LEDRVQPFYPETKLRMLEQLHASKGHPQRSHLVGLRHACADLNGNIGDVRALVRLQHIEEVSYLTRCL